MKSECEIILCYDSKEKTKQVYNSIKVDDFDFVESKIKDCCLKAKIENNNLSSLLHTIDDYLSCAAVADQIVDKN